MDEGQSGEQTGMKCEDCWKEAGTIIHYQGKDRCIKCDEDYQNKMKNQSPQSKPAEKPSSGKQ